MNSSWLQSSVSSLLAFIVQPAIQNDQDEGVRIEHKGGERRRKDGKKGWGVGFSPIQFNRRICLILEKDKGGLF